MVSKIQKLFYSWYISIDFLPAWNYIFYIKTMDSRYFLKLKDYEKLPKIYFKIDDENINQQVSEMTGNRRNELYIELYKRYLKNLGIYYYIQNIVFLLYYKRDEKLIKELEKYGYKERGKYYDWLLLVKHASQLYMNRAIEADKAIKLNFPETGPINWDKVANKIETSCNVNLKQISTKRFLNLLNELSKIKMAA